MKLNGKNVNTFQVAENMKFSNYGNESNKPSKDDMGANIYNSDFYYSNQCTINLLQNIKIYIKIYNNYSYMFRF
jgi:hypothetical protein